MKKIIQPCGLHCIRIKSLGVRFGNEVVLSDINLHIHCGSMTAIIGRNGAGKSTLVRAILGEIPYTGSIEFRNIENGEVKKMKVGYVPQKLNMDKNIPMDVYDLICAFHYRTLVFFRRACIRREILEALSEFDAQSLIDHPIDTLSGGQLQRVLLSMALINEPDLLLLDEAVSGIDEIGTESFYQKIDQLKSHHDLAVIMISHDLDYVRKYADHVVLLDKTVLAQGSAREVFESEAFAETFGEAGGRKEKTE